LTSWREVVPVEARKESSKGASGIDLIPPSPRKTGWLLYGPEFHKKEWHSEYTEELCRQSTEIHRAKELVADFQKLIKCGEVARLRFLT